MGVLSCNGNIFHPKDIEFLSSNEELSITTMNVVDGSTPCSMILKADLIICVSVRITLYNSSR
eukprot:4315596-Ditylum_brightwellii.AAC.1